MENGKSIYVVEKLNMNIGGKWTKNLSEFLNILRLNVQHYDIRGASFSYPHETYSEDNTEHHFDSIIVKLQEPFINMFNVEDNNWLHHYKM